jgi:CheY-like chemotaxis protein
VIGKDVKLLINLEATLNRAGYRVLTAHDGRQAVYLAQAARPEVIVCDVTKPSRSELDVRRTLAQDSQTASIPFIPLTRDRHELVAQVNAVIRSHAYC